MKYFLKLFVVWLAKKLDIDGIRLHPVRHVHYIEKSNNMNIFLDEFIREEPLDGGKLIGYIVAMRITYNVGTENQHISHWEIQWNRKIYSKNQIDKTLDDFHGSHYIDSKYPYFEYRKVPVYINIKNNVNDLEENVKKK